MALVDQHLLIVFWKLHLVWMVVEVCGKWKPSFCKFIKFKLKVTSRDNKQKKWRNLSILRNLFQLLESVCFKYDFRTSMFIGLYSVNLNVDMQSTFIFSKIHDIENS